MEKFFEDPLFNNILNALSDGVLISDGKGDVLWVNDACETLSNKTKAYMVDKNVKELEAEGVFDPSVTRMVIEQQTAVTTVQTADQNRRIIVTGHPIRNKDGAIELIVAQSRDITEIVHTSSELEKTQALLRRYSQEIMKLTYDHRAAAADGYFIGKSEAYLSVLRTVDRIADTNSTVLISGETGTGKNVLAQRLHHLSDRAEGPFIEINCGAIPETLIESELFGYAKGAFTGADKGGKAGLIKMADKGTLFLDEIGEMPLHMQVKLLQFLQKKEFLPVGATGYQKADVRIVAATNLDLMAAVKEGRFRADLFYRLNVLPLKIPSLREREEDIVDLLHFQLEKYNEKHRRHCVFTREALRCLQEYEWPGNIRELENVVERLVLIAAGDEIEAQDLPNDMRPKDSVRRFDTLIDGKTLDEIMDQVEKQVVEQAYRRYGTTRKAAAELGITQSLFMRRVKKYGIKQKRVQNISEN